MKEPRNSLLDNVLAEVSKHNLHTYLTEMPLIVGVSGGADSLALLHLLNALRRESASETLHVAHLNHWVRGKEAHDDADFVREIAQDWGLPYIISRFDVPNYARRHKLSVEDAARRARYAFFAELAQKHNAAIAVAHNADDQVETVLMSILRGTGLRGLAGMQMLSQAHLPRRDESLAPFADYSPDGAVNLFRPLLGVWRWQILDYCKEMELEPRWDSTNWEPKYRRNRVRHDLIPTLQIKYSLAIKEHLYNLSQIAQEEDAWLSQETSGVLARIASSNSPKREVAFAISDFANLSRGTQRRVVREAILSVAGTERDFTFKQVEAAIAILAGDEISPRAMHLPHGLIVERTGSTGYVKLREQLATNYGEETERPLVEQAWQADFEPELSLTTTTGWSLETTLLTETDISPEELSTDKLSATFDLALLQEIGPLEWRTRRPGDLMHPFGMSGSKTLQDIMVDAKIPRGQREYIPLLAAKDRSEIIWIPGKGGRRSTYAPVSPQTSNILIIKWANSNNDGESIARH